MLVMRKLNRELARHYRIAEGVALVVAWRGAQMANRTDGRACPAKELSPVTGNTCLMIRVISNIGKIPHSLPIFGGQLMTGGAGAAMFLGCVRKFGVVNSRFGSCCRPAASLCQRWIEKVCRKKGNQPNQQTHHQPRAPARICYCRAGDVVGSSQGLVSEQSGQGRTRAKRSRITSRERFLNTQTLHRSFANV